LSCCSLARPAQAQIIADSVAEFSGTQGGSNWQYGFYANPGVSPSFTQFTIFNNNVWQESQTFPPYTALFDVGGHPGGANYFPASEHWAVRRYTAEVSSPLLLQGNIAKWYSNVPETTGIVGRIFRNGVEVYSQLITGGDEVGVNYSVRLNNVTAGDLLDFAIDPNGDDYSDLSRFTIKASVVPAPSSLALALMGIVLSFPAYHKRRRIQKTNL